MGTRQDNLRKSTLDAHKSETIGPKKGPVDFGPEVGYGEGENSVPSFTQLEETFNKKYPNLKPLPIMQQLKNRYDPHKSAPNTAFNDIAAAAAIAIPAGRIEEGVAAIVNKMMPALEKAGPKVMAKFADLLKKSKGNPKALENIYTKFKGLDDGAIKELDYKKLGINDRPNFSENPREFSSVRNFMENPDEKMKSREGNFRSRPIQELKGKAKIDTWLKNKPAYERKNMGKIIEADIPAGEAYANRW